MKIEIESGDVNELPFFYNTRIKIDGVSLNGLDYSYFYFSAVVGKPVKWGIGFKGPTLWRRFKHFFVIKYRRCLNIKMWKDSKGHKTYKALIIKQFKNKKLEKEFIRKAKWRMKIQVFKYKLQDFKNTQKQLFRDVRIKCYKKLKQAVSWIKNVGKKLRKN